VRRLPAVLLLAITTTLAVATPPHAAAGVLVAETEVHGDDERDAYVGTGGLILPGTVDQHTRRQVASCPGCRWRLSTPCEMPGSGTAFDGQRACLSVVRGCPGGRLLRSWFQDGAPPWRELGLVCVPPGGPVTVADVGRAARARFERGIPALAPGFQPSHGVLTQLPVVLDSGQPAGTRTWRLDLLGRDVALSATPAWSWRFGDGSGQETSDPGGRYPHLGVAHAYRRAGDYEVTCTATWSGTFIVDGLGPFPVTEPVRQAAALLIEVGEGRALLAPARTARARPPG
jgi:PKD domain